MNVADQQDKALNILRDLAIKESEYRQMGFIGIAQFVREEARKVEKWLARKPLDIAPPRGENEG